MTRAGARNAPWHILRESQAKGKREGRRIKSPVRNPDDSSNAANPLADLQYMVIGGGNDGFSAKQWAICDPALMREMVKLVYITRPTVMQTALDNPLKDLYTGYVDFGCGWGDGRQIIFSNPA